MRSFNLGLNARYKRAVALCEICVCLSLVCWSWAHCFPHCCLWFWATTNYATITRSKYLNSVPHSSCWDGLLFCMGCLVPTSNPWLFFLAHSQTQQSSVCSTQNNIYQALSYHLILFLSDDQFPCTFPAVVFGQTVESVNINRFVIWQQ